MNNGSVKNRSVYLYTHADVAGAIKIYYHDTAPSCTMPEHFH